MSGRLYGSRESIWDGLGAPFWDNQSIEGTTKLEYFRVSICIGMPRNKKTRKGVAWDRSSPNDIQKGCPKLPNPPLIPFPIISYKLLDHTTIKKLSLLVEQCTTCRNWPNCWTVYSNCLRGFSAPELSSLSPSSYLADLQHASNSSEHALTLFV